MRAPGWAMVSWRGHLWTIAPRMAAILRPPTTPRAEPWAHPVHDATLGQLHLRGRLRSPAEATRLLLVVHGLGGHAESPYVVGAASAAEALGWACLRLNLRGADRRGRDFYHAGLTSDLGSVLASPTVRRFEEVYLLGYSLGGHLVLRYLGEEPAPIVRGAVSICAPLDLAAGCYHLDALPQRLYLWHVLGGLKAMYRGCVARGSAVLPWEEARQIRTLHEWDERIVAPRHGFRSAEHYWESTNAASVLHRVRTPTVALWTDDDPMVPQKLVHPALVPNQHIHPIWLPAGGHVGFPPAAGAPHGSVEALAIQKLLDLT